MLNLYTKSSCQNVKFPYIVIVVINNKNNTKYILDLFVPYYLKS